MRTTKIIFISFLLVCSNLYSQTEQAYRVPLPTKSVPPIVLNAFNKQYPDVMLKSWYVTHITYWYNDVSSSWYYNWYGPRTAVVYVYEVPNYFEVEFTDQPGELSRAIYNRFGYWHETRTQLKGLPSNIIESLNDTKYAEWKKSKLKEKIETPEWPEPIYRFRVSKGLKSVIIRMNHEREIIQKKYLKN